MVAVCRGLYKKSGISDVTRDLFPTRGGKSQRSLESETKIPPVVHFYVCIELACRCRLHEDMNNGVH